MNQQIMMVLVSIFSSVIFLVCFFLFRHFFPKRKINYLLLLFIISLLPCLSIFRVGVYESGDFTQHMYRAMVFSDILKEGILIPSWANILNNGYGYPVFIFIYQTHYYLISLIHALGFSFIISGKLLLALAFTGSGLFMYTVLKKLTKNDLASFGGSIIYLFSPYHLVDLHFRVALPETIGFVIAPAIFFLILKLQEKIKTIYVLLLGLLFGIFFLDHPPQFIFYSGLFFLYIVYQIFISRKKNYLIFISTSLAFVIGLLISSYSWIPRFTLSKFTHGSHLMNIPVSFVQPWELLFSPWKYGFLFQGHHGELSFLIGYTQIIVLLLALYLIIRLKNSNVIYKQLLFWTISACFMIFFMLPYSQPFWKLIPFLNLMQFSYRFLHPLIFCLSIITAYLILHFKNNKKIIFIFIVITIMYTVLNWGNRGMIPNLTDTMIRQNIGTSTKYEEGLIEANPLWFDPYNSTWIQTPAKKHLEIIKGTGEIKEMERTSVKHTYMVYTPADTTFLENTFYFPDWTIIIDGKKTKINYTTKEYPGRMVFSTPKGLHVVEAEYNDIPALQVAKKLSITTCLLIAIYFLALAIQKIRKKT